MFSRRARNRPRAEQQEGPGTGSRRVPSATVDRPVVVRDDAAKPLRWGREAACTGSVSALTPVVLDARPSTLARDRCGSGESEQACVRSVRPGGSDCNQEALEGRDRMQ